MPRRGRARRHLTVAALASTLLAGCTAGPSTRPPVVENDAPPPATQPGTPGSPPLPDLDRPKASRITWSGCDDEIRQRLGTQPAAGTLPFSCARMTAALGAPNLPHRGIKRLELLKAGDGPVPLIVVNDVDGEPGTLYAARVAATLPDEMLATFSLIGMDRRGTGESDAVRCIPDEVRVDLLGTDPAVAPDDLLDAARSAGQQCAISLENEQGTLDTWRTAGDLEELRRQLGVDHLNVIGRGEGSRVVAVYAARYPDRVGRVVLDGMPDPSSDVAAVADGIAAGAESTLDAFAADCAQRNCPLGGDARADVTALAEQLRGSPMPTDNGPDLTAVLALRAVRTGLAQDERWPALADAIAAAKAGDAAPLWNYVRPLLNRTGDVPAQLDGILATRCNDSATRLPADRLRAVSRDLAVKYPVFGAVVAQQLAWCSPWPTRTLPLPDIGSHHTPPLVVVSTAVDPVTPEHGTLRAAQHMPTAVTVAWQGTGHGALGSPCVTETVREFLVDGKVPRDGMLCPA